MLLFILALQSEQSSVKKTATAGVASAAKKRETFGEAPPVSTWSILYVKQCFSVLFIISHHCIAHGSPVTGNDECCNRFSRPRGAIAEMCTVDVFMGLTHNAVPLQLRCVESAASSPWLRHSAAQSKCLLLRGCHHVSAHTGAISSQKLYFPKPFRMFFFSFLFFTCLCSFVLCFFWLLAISETFAKNINCIGHYNVCIDKCVK